jgi:putative flavoprotein involved in K+ transport
VMATGPHGRPRIPAGLDREYVLPASGYRNPDTLAPGAVLVVGASSSGVQIADELSRAGRDVTLSVGRHTRVPRRYRGMDIYWWLQVTGRLARTIDTMPDPVAARREPSFQLVGTSSPPEDLDLGVLQHRGVRLVGRLTAANGGVVDLGDDLGRSVADAERRLRRLRGSFDDLARCLQWDRELLPAEPLRRVAVTRPPRRIDLAAEGITTVVVAAGYDPDHTFLRVPVLGADGQIRQERGRTAAPGLYVVGQRFQHRRDSALIDGARYDARDVVDHLVRSRAGRRHTDTRVPLEVTR